MILTTPPQSLVGDNPLGLPRVSIYSSNVFDKLIFN
nr:MAG TPA: hypothetical protein [Crassvirales sp.]